MVQKVNDMGCQSNPRLQRTHSSARFDHCCGCPVRRLARTMPNPYAPYSVVSCMSAYVFLESGGTSLHASVTVAETIPSISRGTCCG